MGGILRLYLPVGCGGAAQSASAGRRKGMEAAAARRRHERIDWIFMNLKCLSYQKSSLLNSLSNFRCYCRTPTGVGFCSMAHLGTSYRIIAFLFYPVAKLPTRTVYRHMPKLTNVVAAAELQIAIVTLYSTYSLSFTCSIIRNVFYSPYGITLFTKRIE